MCCIKFESNLLWHSSQHGFCKKCSCNTQLLEVITDFHRMADEGLRFYCIYIDFSKAFDKISIPLLLQKCEVYHLGARTLNWIGDYLTDRTQKLIVGDALSSAEIVLSGVPQGSCLGPVFFCLFINDLPLVVHHSTVKMFADVAKLFCSLTNSDEASLLQKDLDAVHNWCDANSLFVNENNCRVVHCFGKVEQSYQYHLAGHSILPVENVRDLGVHFDSSLRFDRHVSEVTRMVNYQLLCLRRNFRKFNLRSFSAIYKSTVRPMLEHSSSVWYPLNKKDRTRVEKSTAKSN